MNTGTHFHPYNRTNGSDFAELVFKVAANFCHCPSLIVSKSWDNFIHATQTATEVSVCAGGRGTCKQLTNLVPQRKLTKQYSYLQCTYCT